MSRTDYTITHRKVTTDKPFEDVRLAFESQLGPVDEQPYTDLSAGADAQEIRVRLEKIPGSSGMTNFHCYDHGALLRIKGLDRKALSYVVGNSLIAIEMTQFSLDAAVHLPFRLELYVDEAGKTVFAYDLPSSILKRFADPRIDETGAMLDSKVAAVIEKSIH